LDKWRLRRGTQNDIDGVLTLTSQPAVYRFLFDGVAPDSKTIAVIIAQSVATASETGLGMWLLAGPSAPYCGCVVLRPDLPARSAELTYLLHPAFWGQGLATRMAWTAITQAFLSAEIRMIVAGTDLPNTASLAVMRRLRMRFHRNVRYPLGAGVEYVRHRDDPAPEPCPGLILFGS
jgi:RimJ/RimL family protein N-acetyltransferase